MKYTTTNTFFLTISIATYGMDRDIQALTLKDYYRAFNTICSLIKKLDEKNTEKVMPEKKENNVIFIQKSKL